MRVQSEDSKGTPSGRKIASDYFLKIRDSAPAPIFDAFAFEKMHLLKNIDGRYNVTALKNETDRTADPRVKFVSSIIA